MCLDLQVCACVLIFRCVHVCLCVLKVYVCTCVHTHTHTHIDPLDTEDSMLHVFRKVTTGIMCMDNDLMFNMYVYICICL
jgi:hypothetical protein